MWFTSPTRIFWGDVSDLLTGYPCGVWSPGLTPWSVHSVEYRLVLCKNAFVIITYIYIISALYFSFFYFHLLDTWYDKHTKRIEQLQINHFSSLNWCLNVTSLLIFFEAIAWNIIHAKLFPNCIWMIIPVVKKNQLVKIKFKFWLFSII